MTHTQSIPTDALICMHDYAARYHYRINLAYATDDNLLFGERIYKHTAKLWLHQDLANIVFKAADHCFRTYSCCFVLYDGLRTVEAQEKMMRTKRARDNPHWMEPPRLLSPAGAGGHPRGMAIDIGLETIDGDIIDMGCAFDDLADNPHPDHNPAHRTHPHSESVTQNRAILDTSMTNAARQLQTPLHLLSEEWWDFRLPSATYSQYPPLSDNDLPEHIRMVK